MFVFESCLSVRVRERDKDKRYLLRQRDTQRVRKWLKARGKAYKIDRERERGRKFKLNTKEQCYKYYKIASCCIHSMIFFFGWYAFFSTLDHYVWVLCLARGTCTHWIYCVCAFGSVFFFLFLLLNAALCCHAVVVFIF